MRELSVESLAVRGFRNISQLEISLGPRLNVVSGDNGQGKTNLLEALYVLATSRSFRTTRAADLVTHGGDIASIRGAVRELVHLKHLHAPPIDTAGVITDE